mmetsp:Transcript_21947/g.32619  ORF Transcript_21947/g.32619 Transcript_21947/m.32619 type:complete len:86 (+) Transcript_21947:495-752(+)
MQYLLELEQSFLQQTKDMEKKDRTPRFWYKYFAAAAVLVRVFSDQSWISINGFDKIQPILFVHTASGSARGEIVSQRCESKGSVA